MKLLGTYWFWLLCISLFCLLLEKFAPWRKQKVLRKQIGQDLFWLVFNGHLFAIIIASPSAWLDGSVKTLFQAVNLPQPALLTALPFWIQFLLLLLVKDFVEWWVHYFLHRTPMLWRFHKVHHSILEMDWIGNMRFHWMEIIIYRTVKYIPMVIMGAHWRVLLAIAIFSTLIGHLNHSNLNTGWGKLGYIFNSPRFHIWHHDYINHLKYGQNFAIIFSFWDRIFQKAYTGRNDQPARLGFKGDGKFPQSLLARILLPLKFPGRAG